MSLSTGGVQLAYKLEPAGSHGVWGLDDYQFLPFLLGAAQLSGHDSTPASVTDKRLQEELYEDYLYYEGIRFIGMVKTGPFFEHSVRNMDVDGSAPRTHRTQLTIELNYHYRCCCPLSLYHIYHYIYFHYHYWLTGGGMRVLCSRS